MLCKIIRFKKDREEEHEACVLCKKGTNIKKIEPIDMRYGYVEGVGQLCYECYKKIEDNI